MNRIDLNSIEYFIYTEYKRNREFLEYLDISYNQNREYYYPLLEKDSTFFQKSGFAPHQKNTCLFYTTQVLYLGILTHVSDSKLYYCIYSTYNSKHPDVDDDLFIEVDNFFNTRISLSPNQDVYRNPRYNNPRTNGFLTHKLPQNDGISNIDVIYMNENKSIMALYKNPIYFPKAGTFPWKNGRIDNRSVDYWTILHLETAGVVTPDGLLHKYNYDKFYNLIINASKSPYEKAFIRCYINYLSSLPPNKRFSTPLLIPEFRFDNRAIKHLYRLDFLIINLRTSQKIGIELSPSSTHYASNRLSPLEFYKRNAFLETYGISIFTFLQDDLNNIQSCFNRICKYLN